MYYIGSLREYLEKMENAKLVHLYIKFQVCRDKLTEKNVFLYVIVKGLFCFWFSFKFGMFNLNTCLTKNRKKVHFFISLSEIL